MTNFTLAPQLEEDSLFVRDLSLSQLRLFNQQNIPWLILIPRRADTRELHQLSPEDRAQLMDEITLASRALEQIYSPDKINVGALGNMVPQLHIHVIARFKDDDAWPAPVWGRLMPEFYTPAEIEAVRAKLNAPELWVSPQT